MPPIMIRNRGKQWNEPTVARALFKLSLQYKFPVEQTVQEERREEQTLQIGSSLHLRLLMEMMKMLNCRYLLAEVLGDLSD